MRSSLPSATIAISCCLILPAFPHYEYSQMAAGVSCKQNIVAPVG